MYKLSSKEAHNASLHKLLNQGNRYALVLSNGCVLAHTRYKYQLEIVHKCNRGSKIVLITDLMA